MLFIGTFYGIDFFKISKMFTCAIEKKQTN